MDGVGASAKLDGVNTMGDLARVDASFPVVKVSTGRSRSSLMLSIQLYSSPLRGQLEYVGQSR